MLRTLFVKKSVFICRVQYRIIKLHFILYLKSPQGTALGGVNNLYCLPNAHLKTCGFSMFASLDYFPNAISKPSVFSMFAALT